MFMSEKCLTTAVSDQLKVAENIIFIDGAVVIISGCNNISRKCDSPKDIKAIDSEKK